MACDGTPDGPKWTAQSGGFESGEGVVRERMNTSALRTALNGPEH